MKYSIIAHRGGTDLYPELTIDAARYSLKLGADFIEMDVRLTYDGVPVISHDRSCARLFGCKATVESMPLHEFTALRYKNNPNYYGFTLEKLLESGVHPFLLHIKTSDNLSIILKNIYEHKCMDQIIMGVVSAKDVETVKEYDKTIKVLSFSPSYDSIDDFIDSGADIIRLWESWVNLSELKKIHEKRRLVWIMAGSPYPNSSGMTSDENILLWREMGADGVILNKISQAMQVLKK